MYVYNYIYVSHVRSQRRRVVHGVLRLERSRTADNNINNKNNNNNMLINDTIDDSSNSKGKVIMLRLEHGELAAHDRGGRSQAFSSLLLGGAICLTLLV